jgi:uncharacterized protein
MQFRPARPLPPKQSSPGRPPARRLPGLALLIGAILIWIASDIAVPSALAPWTDRLQNLVTVFLGIVIEALPFLLAGVLVSSVIHLYVSDTLVQRWSPHHPLPAALAGAVLGLAFPVCECGSIPTARRLLTKGTGLPTGIAFVLAAPVINPIVLIATFVAFGGWDMVAWRAGLTVLFAVIIGVLLGTPRDPGQVLLPAVCYPHSHDHAHQDCDHDHDHEHDHNHEQAGGPLSRILNHANTEFFEMGRYLVIGSLLAASLQTLIPQQWLLSLGSGPVISVLVMIALATVLSICSTVDSFIALSFVNTFTRGSILAFLVFGPMIDIKSTLMLTRVFRPRIIAMLILLIFQLNLLAGILINYYIL